MIDSHNRDHKHDLEDARRGNAIVALFETRAEAKRALGALHKAHFTKTWFATTSAAVADGGEETLTAESGGSSGFFTAHSTRLLDALVERDVDADVARRIEMEAVPGCSIVIVTPPNDEKHDPSTALDILAGCGGVVEGRSTGVAVAGGIRSSYTPSFDDGGDDSLLWEEETFYRRE